jgi:hypothetical protein
VNNVGSKTLLNPVKQRAQRFYDYLPSLATKDERSLIKTLPIGVTKFNDFTEKVQCLSRAL